MDMNERVDRLEVIAEKTSDRLYALEKEVAIIRETGATKTDIAELRSEMKSAVEQAKSSTIIWVVGAVFLAQVLPVLLRKFGM